MEVVFAPWVNELQADVDNRMKDLDQADLDAAVDYKTAAAAHAQVTAAKRPPALKAVLKSRRFQVLFESIDADFAPEAFSETQQAALTRAREIMDAKWQGGEIKTRLELIRRLTQDARAVFGTGQLVVTDKRAGTSEWQQKPEVDKPPVMQYLERGFVRRDEPNTSGRGAKQVFNSQFVHAMMLHGFHPLGAYESVDMMHFDFREGYNAIKGGPGDTFGPND